MIVYRHRRNDTLEIFYIGIGKEEKRGYSTRHRNRYWHNIVNKCGYTVEIIANPDTWEEACDLEMLLISEYGRRDLGTGNLVNLTSGGDGSLGRVLTNETRAKMSIVASNMSEETKAKIGEAVRGSKGGNSKLTEQQVYEIKYSNFNRTLLSNYSTYKEIAFVYGVSLATVWGIRNNKTWKHI